MTRHDSASPRALVQAVIPAAGNSRRMGRPKQILPYGGSTLVGTVTRTLLSAGVDRVVVVMRSNLIDSADLPSDPRVVTAVNDRQDAAMIDSLRVGLDRLALETTASIEQDASDDAKTGGGVLVVPGDMPMLSEAACRACIDAFAAAPDHIIIATYQGRRGHPMIFPWSMRSAVDELDGGLNQLPDRYRDRVRLVETGDSGVTRDIDTEDDYRQVTDPR